MNKNDNDDNGGDNVRERFFLLYTFTHYNESFFLLLLFPVSVSLPANKSDCDNDNDWRT